MRQFLKVNNKSIILLVIICILVAVILFGSKSDESKKVMPVSVVDLDSLCDVGDSCCRDSFTILKNEKFEMIEANGDCETGYVRNKLKCETSLSWCELENLSFGEEVFLVEVPDEDRKCESDDDCIVFQPDCGNCVIDVINKKSFNEHENEKFAYCSRIETVYTVCNLEIGRDGKCENDICVMADSEDIVIPALE